MKLLLPNKNFKHLFEFRKISDQYHGRNTENENFVHNSTYSDLRYFSING